MEYDPLLLKANESPIVTRYIGGRVLSFFTLTMVMCSIALVVLTSFIYIEYKPASESLRDTYLADGASLSYGSVVNVYLTNITSARILTDNKVPYAEIFGLCPGILTIVEVVNSTTPYYVRASWNSDKAGVKVVSNKIDCVSSRDYECDSEISSTDIRQSEWYLRGADLAANENLWSSPVPYIESATRTVSNAIELVWKTNAIDGVTYTLNLISVETDPYLNFSENGLLGEDKGNGGVYLVHSDSEKIVTALGLDPSQFITFNDQSSSSEIILASQTLTNISSITVGNGDWISRIISYNVEDVYPGTISAVVYPVSNSPYSIVVASDASSFDEDSISTLSLASVCVAIVPLLATSVVLLNYLFRVFLIGQKKKRRRAEVSDATLALESVKMRKLAEVESLRSRSARLAQTKVSERITEAGNRM